MHKVTALGLVAGLLVSSVPVQAGPLLESALRRANKALPGSVVGQSARTGCATAATDGSTDGQQRQGSVGWFVGGLFLPVIMPIVAHVSTPQPPADTVLRYSGDDARCYAAAYSDTAAGKRKKGAWIGSATAIGLLMLAVASAGDTRY